jgi:hypothetical protein
MKSTTQEASSGSAAPAHSFPNNYSKSRLESFHHLYPMAQFDLPALSGADVQRGLKLDLVYFS